MKQPRYDSLTSLLTGGTSASAGANTHGAGLNLVYGTKALIDQNLNELVTVRDARRTAVADVSDLYKVLETKRVAAYAISSAARDVLKRSIGLKYSQAWQGTGFTNSLQVPVSVSGLEDMTRSLHSYLVANPDIEVEKLQVTAADAETALNELVLAKTAIALKKSAAGTLLTTRKQKEKAMRRRLRGLIEELGRAMEPLDDRWIAFGLNKPGLQETPNRPTKVNVTLQGSNAAVKWGKVARAEYYRIWLKVIGLHLDPIPVGSPADLDFLIESLPPASQAEVSVSAVNNGGESARSEVVVVTTL